MAEQSIDLEREKIERETEQIKQVLSGRLVIDSSEGEYSSEEESDHEEKLAIASPVEPFRSSVSPRISNAGSRASSQLSRDTLILTPHTMEGVRSRPSSGLVVAGPSSAPDVGYQQEEEDQTEAEVQGLIQDLEPEEVLELNQNYQEYIHDMLNRVQLMLAQNRERQTALKSELTESDRGSDGRVKRGHGLWNFFKPYFKDSYGNGPPPNEDSRHKREEKTVNPFVCLSKKWSAKDHKTLYAAVRSDGMQKKTRSLMNKLEIYTTKLREGAEGADRKELQGKVQDIREEINKITREPDSELLGDRLDPHDWDKIANVDFDGVQTPSACQLQWQNVAHPSINKENWTEEETSRLEAIAAAHGAEDWAGIAQELGTGRTAIQCLRKYQTDINNELRKTKWSPEEDALLTELVEKLRLGGYIPYQQIAYFMEGRTISQICHRWAKTVDPNVRRGKWSVDEDIALLTAVAKFGARDWWKMSRLVPGRTDAQVRERYMNVLDPEIKRGPFTNYEDKQVMGLYEKYGPAWSTIANEIPGRTDNMVLRRFEMLLKQKNITYLPLVRKPNAPVERHSDRMMAKYLGMSVSELLKRREKRLAIKEEQGQDHMSIKPLENKKPNKEKLYRLIELYKEKKRKELENPEPEQKPEDKTQKIHLLLTTHKKRGGQPRRDPRLDIVEAGILEVLKPPPEKVVKLASGRPRRHKTNKDVLVKKLAASAPPSKLIFTRLLKALHIDIPGALGMIKERQKLHALSRKDKIKDQLEAREKLLLKPPIVQRVLLPVPTVTIAPGNQPSQAVQRPATLLPLQQVRTAFPGIQVLRAPILQQTPAPVGAQAVQKVGPTACSRIVPPASASAVPASKDDKKLGPSAVSKDGAKSGPTTVSKAASSAVSTRSATAGARASTGPSDTDGPAATIAASPSGTATSTADTSNASTAVPTTSTGPSAVPTGGAVSSTTKPPAALPQVVNVMMTGKPDKPGEKAPNVGQFLIVLPAGMKMVRPPTLMPAVQLQPVTPGGAAQQAIRPPLPMPSCSTTNTSQGTGISTNTTQETGTSVKTSQGIGTSTDTTQGIGTTANTTQGTGTSTANTTKETRTSVKTSQGIGTSTVTGDTTQGIGTTANTTHHQGTGTPVNTTEETGTLPNGQDRPEGLVSLAQVAAKLAADNEAKEVSAGEKDSTSSTTPTSSPSTTRKVPKRKTRASTKTPTSPAPKSSSSAATKTPPTVPNIIRSSRSAPATKTPQTVPNIIRSSRSSATVPATQTPETVPKVIRPQPAKSTTKQIIQTIPIVTRAAPTATVPVQIAPAPQRPSQGKVVRASNRKVSKVALLAPNSATLNGFKSLLLGRKKLVAEFEKLLSVRHARTAGLVVGPQSQSAAMATPSRAQGLAGFDDSASGSETSPRPVRTEPPSRLPSSVVNPHKDSYCYNMLKNRFDALFLWPALLSTATVDVKPPQKAKKKGGKPKSASLNFIRQKRQKQASQKGNEASKNTQADGETPADQPAASTSGAEVKKRRVQKTELHGEGEEAPQRRSTRLAARPPIRYKRKYTKRKLEDVTLEEEEEDEEAEEEDGDQDSLYNGTAMKEEENGDISSQHVGASSPAAMDAEEPACDSMAESQADNVETGVDGGSPSQKDIPGQITLLISSPEKGLRSVGATPSKLKEAGHGDLSQSDNEASPYEKYDRYKTGMKSSGSDELGSPSQGGTPLKRPLEDASAGMPPGDGKRKYKKRRTIRDMLQEVGKNEGLIQHVHVKQDDNTNY